LGIPRPRHLEAVDVVRALTVVGVIAVHSIPLTSQAGSLPAGAATIVLHVNREVFFLLTAFVLTYSLGARRLRLGSFYARRYSLVVTPYVAWTLIYFCFNGELHSPALTALHRLADELATGSARFHLYFLLVTMQIYLVFPLLLWLVRATRGHHRLVFALSLAMQLGFVTAVHYRLPLPGPLGAWAQYPDTALPSYQLYVVTGALAADHLDELTAWVRRNGGAVAAACVCAVLLSEVSYLRDIYAGGLAPLDASQVFQPVVVVDSLAVFLGLFTLGVSWADRRRPLKFDRLIGEGSRRSFGVFLAHPLLLQGVLWVGSSWGLITLLQRAPAGVTLAVGLGFVVPLVLLLSWALIGLAMRSPLTLPITGRRQPPIARCSSGRSTVQCGEGRGRQRDQPGLAALPRRTRSWPPTRSRSLSSKATASARRRPLAWSRVRNAASRRRRVTASWRWLTALGARAQSLG
jgi:peptidoglycan/LPS O-acetylase OafA/YrhL